MNTASTRLEGTTSCILSSLNVTNSANARPEPQAHNAHAQHTAAATQAHCSLEPVKAGTGAPASGRARVLGSAGNGVRAMERRLAEFREARKRAGLAAEPSTSRQRAQTSGEKAEAAATPKAAPGLLKRFLVWKLRPASAQAQPNLAQVRETRPHPRVPGL